MKLKRDTRSKDQKNPRNRSLKSSTILSRHIGSKEWKSLRESKWLEAQGLCSYCGYLTIPGHRYLNFHLDHIKPINHKNATMAQVCDETNTQILCSFCHMHKTIEENSTGQSQLVFVCSETGDVSFSPFQSHKKLYRMKKLARVQQLMDQGKLLL